jgi:glyoxylase-like metal-dependent hydrolase (beta-lactamase superfamily II)
MAAAALPGDIRLLERGWLSSNSIVLLGEQPALVDSGYHLHAPQTVVLVQQQLGSQPLAVLANTHLHSDHCGGNAALQAAYPGVRTLIPPGHAAHVRVWDDQALSDRPTGQECPRFTFDALLQPGTTCTLGARSWQVHAAPGHDPESVLLFAPDCGVLLSADALWQRGLGVIFPELEDAAGFAPALATLDLIAALAPRVVLPGHGAAFTDVADALAFARARIMAFQRDPASHLRHAVKVLLKFHLLAVQRRSVDDLLAWAQDTPYLVQLHTRHFAQSGLDAWLLEVVDALVRSGAAQRDGDWVLNA